MQEQLSHTSNSLAFPGLASDFLRKKHLSRAGEGCIVMQFQRKPSWRKAAGKSDHNLQGNMTQQTISDGFPFKCFITYIRTRSPTSTSSAT